MSWVVDLPESFLHKPLSYFLSLVSSELFLTFVPIQFKLPVGLLDPHPTVKGFTPCADPTRSRDEIPRGKEYPVSGRTSSKEIGPGTTRPRPHYLFGTYFTPTLSFIPLPDSRSPEIRSNGDSTTPWNLLSGQDRRFSLRPGLITKNYNQGSFVVTLGYCRIIFISYNPTHTIEYEH